MGSKFREWIKKLKRDRSEVDRMVNSQKKAKDDHANSPEGFEATVSEEKKYRGL